MIINYYGQFKYGDRSSLYVSLVTFFNGFWNNDISVGFQYDNYKMKNSNIHTYYEDENSLNGIFRVFNVFRLSEKQNIWGYLNFRYYSPNIYLTQKNISYPVFNLELKKIWSQCSLSIMANDIFQGEKSISRMTSNQKLSPYIKNRFTIYPDNRYVIRDNGEAKKYIDCEGEENITYPDFDKYTLLLTNSTTLYGVEKVESSLIKENDTNYIYEVKVKTNLTAVAEGYIIAVLVPQLPPIAKVTKRAITNGIVVD